MKAKELAILIKEVETAQVINLSQANFRLILAVAYAVTNALHKASKKSKWIRFWLIGKYIVQGLLSSGVELDEVEEFEL